MQNNEMPKVASTLENIDMAMYRFVDEEIDVHTTTNKGREKVKVLWLGTERAFQIKNNKELRDGVGKLRLPLLTVSRTSVSRDDDFKGSFQLTDSYEVINGQDYIPVKTVINQEKTQNFQNSDLHTQTEGQNLGKPSSKKVVYETHYIPKPVYITCMFEINIRTEYQQQMNEIVSSFIPENKNYVIIANEGYQYEAFIQNDYNINNSTNLGQEERMFTSKVQIKVLGYITGPQNGDQSFIVKKESVVEVKVSREKVIIGDSKPWDKSGEKFRDL